MPSAASTSRRQPLSELPLSLFLPTLTAELEGTPALAKGKDKDRDGSYSGSGRDRERVSSTNKDAARPGSPLKPRALLAPSAKLDLAHSTSASGLMSPAKRRLLAGSPRSPRKSASMSSLRAPHISTSTALSGLGSSASTSALSQTPARRMMHLDDELMRAPSADEEPMQREWEARSPARRLFADGESIRERRVAQGSPLATLAPRPTRGAGIPAFLDAPAAVDGMGTIKRSGAGLAPSPPIADKAPTTTGAAPGSPTTPRPSKRSRVTKGSPAVAAPKTAAGEPLPLPRATATASPARSRSRAPINLLDDLEDDVFSSPARATPSRTTTGSRAGTPSSSRSRSTTAREPSATSTSTSTPTRGRTRSASSASVHSDTEIYYDTGAEGNIDVSTCGFEIWDDEAGQRERERMDSARSVVGVGNTRGRTGTVDDGDVADDEVDQENQPPVIPLDTKPTTMPLDTTDSGVRLDGDADVMME